jgi:hypothetical protein
MHPATLFSLAIAALTASAQPLAPRDELNIDYFTCDSADSTAVCSDKPDSTEAFLETGMIPTSPSYMKSRATPFLLY